MVKLCLGSQILQIAQQDAGGWDVENLALIVGFKHCKKILALTPIENVVLEEQPAGEAVSGQAGHVYTFINEPSL